MGRRVWVFIINDDDSVERFPLAKFERLTRESSEERLPLYAGQQVNCALVAITFEDRTPQSIDYVGPHTLVFDGEGRVDRGPLDRLMNFVEIDPFKEVFPRTPGSEIVIDKQEVFSKKRYDREVAPWSLNAKAEKAIEAAVFARPRFPRLVT